MTKIEEIESSKELSAIPSGFLESFCLPHKRQVSVFAVKIYMSVEVKVQRDKYQQKCKHDCIIMHKNLKLRECVWGYNIVYKCVNEDKRSRLTKEYILYYWLQKITQLCYCT